MNSTQVWHDHVCSPALKGIRSFNLPNLDCKMPHRMALWLSSFRYRNQSEILFCWFSMKSSRLWEANTKSSFSLFSWICLKVPDALNTTLKQSVAHSLQDFATFYQRQGGANSLSFSSLVQPHTPQHDHPTVLRIVFPCFLILTDPGVCNAQRLCKVTSLSWALHWCDPWKPHSWTCHQDSFGAWRRNRIGPIGWQKPLRRTTTRLVQRRTMGCGAAIGDFPRRNRCESRRWSHHFGIQRGCWGAWWGGMSHVLRIFEDSLKGL